MTTEFGLEILTSAERVGPLDLRAHAAGALKRGESVRWVVVGEGDNRVETIVIDATRAGQALNADARWGDWRAESQTIVLDDRGTVRLDGSLASPSPRHLSEAARADYETELARLTTEEHARMAEFVAWRDENPRIEVSPRLHPVGSPEYIEARQLQCRSQMREVMRSAAYEWWQVASKARRALESEMAFLDGVD